MSNLRIYVDNSVSSLQQAASAACGDASPAPPQRGPRPADACRLTLPVTLDVPNPPAPRQIALDRQGDRFVLSAANSSENLTWIATHQNLASILDIARLTGSLMRSSGRRAATDRFAVGFFVWISRYVLTGQVPHDGMPSARLAEPDIEGVLLELFTGTQGLGLAPLVGNINLLRRETALSEETRERIRRVTAILDLVPGYRAFLAHFISESEQDGIGRLSDADFTRIAQVYTFLRGVVVGLANHRPLRFDATALNAARAYGDLHRAEIASGARPDFCAALRAAFQERGGSESPVANFVEECRSGLEWAGRAPEAALRESLRSTLVNPGGLSLLQQAIAEESARANMRIDWLARRDSFGRVFSALRDNIRLVTGEGGVVRLGFDISAFRQSLRLMTALTQRGEYDLAALALLRRLFGSNGTPPRLRAFADRHFQELDWQLSAADLVQIRELMTSLAGRRSGSAGFAETGMPILEGAGCALGTGGILLSHALPAIAQNPSLRLGLGTTSAGIAGAGCFGLAGHYVWPAAIPRAVHNRYAWDLGSAAVGSGLSIATYLLINLLGGGAANRDRRLPVDSYGP